MAVRILIAILCAGIAVQMTGAGHELWNVSTGRVQLAVGAAFGYIALDILGLLGRK